MNATLKDKRVLILGGSSGIGLAVARQAHERGAQLVLAGRNQLKVQQAAEEFEVQALIVDAHDEAATQQLFDQLAPVDYLVSLVGDSMSGSFSETAEATMRQVIHSKFWSNWIIGKYGAAKVRPGGAVIFTSGTGARPHEASATVVANAGLQALVQGLAVELAPDIRVHAVAPTFMGAKTEFWKEVSASSLDAMEAGFAQKVPLKRVGTPQEVASVYIHLMENGFITGQVVAVDGGVMLP